MTTYLAWWLLIYLVAGQWTVMACRAPGRRDVPVHLLLVLLWPLVALVVALHDASELLAPRGHTD